MDLVVDQKEVPYLVALLQPLDQRKEDLVEVKQECLLNNPKILEWVVRTFFVILKPISLILKV